MVISAVCKWYIVTTVFLVLVVLAKEQFNSYDFHEDEDFASVREPLLFSFFHFLSSSILVSDLCRCMYVILVINRLLIQRC